MLFNFQIFVTFFQFSFCHYLVSFHLGWNIHHIISIFLILLRLVLRPNVISPIECSCVFKKNVYSVAIRLNSSLYVWGPFHLLCYSTPPFPCWSSVGIFYLLLKVRHWNLLLVCCYLFLPLVLSMFASCIWCSDVGAYVIIIVIFFWKIYPFIII